MKRFIMICMSIVFCNNALSMKLATIKIVYEPALLQVLDLRDIRSKDEASKADRFKTMAAAFPLDAAIKRIKRLDNPQVVLWFTNYFGKVTKRTLRWYKGSLMSKLPATFWLTDLKAWSLLSAGEDELAMLTLVKKLKAEGQLTPQECPLLGDSSCVVDEALNAVPGYRVLASKSFFTWLLEVKDMSLVSDEACNALCKDIRRSDSLPFSLSQMGYRPKLLERIVPRYQKNMLEVEFSLIYPVLQFLEGMFYAACIIESNLQALERGENLSLVFLLPNKEFTYFVVPQEDACFQYFQEGIQKIVARYSERIKGTITIIMEPFAYGKDLYDGPYKLGGGLINSKNAFLSELQKNDEPDK